MRKLLTGIFAVFLFAAGSSAYSQNISAIDARDLALSITGGGVISSLELVSAGTADPVYQIVILNNDLRYEVSINARTGDIFRLTTSQAGAVSPQLVTPHQTAPQGGNIVIGNVTPRRPARLGGPVNPPVSAQRAVEIARDHLVSIGVTTARFDYVYMDRERGRWVWSVEFDGRGREYEFYIDVDTGAIIKFESDN